MHVSAQVGELHCIFETLAVLNLSASPWGAPVLIRNRLVWLQGMDLQTVDAMIALLEGRGDSKLSKAEWFENLRKCVGLAHTIEACACVGTPEYEHMATQASVVKWLPPVEAGVGDKESARLSTRRMLAWLPPAEADANDKGDVTEIRAV